MENQSGNQSQETTDREVTAGFDMNITHDWSTIDRDVKCILVEMKVTWLDGDPTSESTNVIASKSFFVNSQMRPVAEESGDNPKQS